MLHTPASIYSQPKTIITICVNVDQVHLSPQLFMTLCLVRRGAWYHLAMIFRENGKKQELYGREYFPVNKRKVGNSCERKQEKRID